MEDQHWIERVSKKHGRNYWFNTDTGESSWTKPESMIREKSVCDRNSSSSTTECSLNLLGKRNFLFRDISKRDKLVIDDIAAFSVTESRSADAMTAVISTHCDPNFCAILDGMACVGGNSISFSKAFKSVISNELDVNRFQMLMHNTQSVMELDNILLRNENILELVSKESFEVLFLDPEWGGPNYKDFDRLRLRIGEVSVEDFVLRVFKEFPGVLVVALKLPTNYDNEFLQRFAIENNLSYDFYTHFRKMTLTVLKKKL